MFLILWINVIWWDPTCAFLNFSKISMIYIVLRLSSYRLIPPPSTWLIAFMAKMWWNGHRHIIFREMFTRKSLSNFSLWDLCVVERLFWFQIIKDLFLSLPASPFTMTLGRQINWIKFGTQILKFIQDKLRVTIGLQPHFYNRALHLCQFYVLRDFHLYESI